MTMRTTSARGLALVALLALVGSGVDPLQSLYRLNREGLDALAEGDAERATALLERARELAPDDPRLAYNLASALAEAGRLDEAASAYDAAAEAVSAGVARDANFNRGLMELGREEPAAAVESFSRALMIDPSDEEARRNLEIALSRLPPPPPSQNAPQENESDPDSESERERSGENPQGESGETQESRPEEGERKGEAGDEGDRGEEAPPEESQRSEDGGDEGEPDSGEDRGSEESAGAEGSAGKEGEPRGGDAEMAKRVLKALAKAEEEALRRALGRRLDEEVPASDTEKDW